jgi:hypothetical protein
MKIIPPEGIRVPPHLEAKYAGNSLRHYLS